jgi:flagellar biosynthesis component FlhA
MDDKVVNVNGLMEQVRKSLSEERIKELQGQKPEIASAFLRGEIDKLLAEKSYEEVKGFVDSSTGVRLIGQYHAAAHTAEGMQQMMAMMAMKQHIDGVRDAIFSIVHMAVANSILASNKDIRFDINHHFLWSVKVNEQDPEDLKIEITRYAFEPKTPDEIKDEEGDSEDQPVAAPEPSKN